jgi:hypothetical protein
VVLAAGGGGICRWTGGYEDGVAQQEFGGRTGGGFLQCGRCWCAMRWGICIPSRASLSAGLSCRVHSPILTSYN